MTETKKRARTPAHRKADKVFDAKRPAPVPVRFSEAELDWIDRNRGELSRSAFIRERALEGYGE